MMTLVIKINKKRETFVRKNCKSVEENITYEDRMQAHWFVLLMYLIFFLIQLFEMTLNICFFFVFVIVLEYLLNSVSV